MAGLLGLGHRLIELLYPSRHVVRLERSES